MHKRDIKAEDASTGLAFIRIYNKWHTKLKKELNNFGITIPQFSVMSVISYLNQSDQFVTQAKISKMADIDVVTVSQVVRGLEKKGFLERFQNPLDSRANAVRLLSKGDEIIKLTFPVVEQSNEAFFGVLAEKEIAFRELLHKLL